MSVEDRAAPEGRQLPIALAGFMGVGKSAIGRSAARALGRPFYDSDDVAEERLGAAIVDLFREGKELVFRDAEEAVIADLLDLDPPPVIALGGGALLRRTTLERLLSQALLVHLHLPWTTLKDVLPRLRKGRPLLENRSPDEVRALYEQREAIYAQCPITVELRRDGVDNGCAALLAALEPYGIAAPTPS